MQLIDILKVNLERCNRWHKGGIQEWTLDQWLTATVGELGEAANALKKKNRILMGAANVNDEGRQITELAKADAMILDEFADTWFYLCLTAMRNSSPEKFAKHVEQHSASGGCGDGTLLGYLKSFQERSYFIRTGMIDNHTLDEWMTSTTRAIGQVASDILYDDLNIHFSEAFFCLCVMACRVAGPEAFEAAIVSKFNSVSDRYGFPDRLVVGNYVVPPGNGIH